MYPVHSRNQTLPLCLCSVFCPWHCELHPRTGLPLDPKMAVGSEHNPTLPHSHLVGDCCHLGSPREVPRQSKRNCDGGEVELNSAETKDGSIAKCWGELVRRHWRTSVGRRVNAVGASVFADWPLWLDFCLRTETGSWEFYLP